MWKVRLFYKTGLNTVNILDGPGRLDSAEHLDVPAIDILKGEKLSSVTIKATREQVKEADYMMIWEEGEAKTDSFFYTVDDFTPTSKDVQILSVTFDALMTLEQRVGGIGNITFSDGITSRVHVPKEKDTYGTYTEDDPLLTPIRPLEMEIYHVFEDLDTVEATEGVSKKIIVESTVSLDYQGQKKEAAVYESGDGSLTVTVPQVFPINQNTDIYMGEAGQPNQPKFTTPATEYFDAENESVKQGLQAVRSLGVEGCILNSYVLPAGYGIVNQIDGRIIDIHGTGETRVTTISRDYATVENKRLLYGDINKLVFASVCSGARVEFMPEDIFLHSDNSDTDKYLRVSISCDCRPNGRPYFSPAFYKDQESSIGKFSFYHNPVPGMEWANAPLTYTGQSGSKLTEIQYNTRMEEMKSGMNAAEVGNMINLGTGLVSSLTGAPSSPNVQNPMAMSNLNGQNVYSYNMTGRERYKALQGYNVAMGNYANDIASYAAGAVGGVINAGVGYAYNDWNIKRQYELNSRSEYQKLMIAQKVVQPEVHFPMSESLRDFLGNHLVILRYTYATEDIPEIDKRLNMYGYRLTKNLEGTDFTNRSKFNFVAVSNVTITGDQPMWLRELAASQLQAGVRVWHQLPDISAYTDGSNV